MNRLLIMSFNKITEVIYDSQLLTRPNNEEILQAAIAHLIHRNDVEILAEEMELLELLPIVP